MNGHKFKKKLGQNFLKDNNISNKIVNLVNLNKDSLVIEVGPGSGALTKLLSARAKVLAYEIDLDLKEGLEKQFVSSDVAFIFDDFLNRDITKDIASIDYYNLFFVANLPYYITTPIIEKIIDSNLNFDKIVIMVQKEVAERFASPVSTKSYSSITVYLNYHFDIKQEFIVPATCFYPRPNVDSAIISLNPKENRRRAKNEEHFYKLVKDAFVHKRKNIKNNLFAYDMKLIEEYLLSKKLELSVRAEQLTLDNFIDISDILSA